MDSFELTKIAGAVLSALLVIFGTKTAIELSHHGHGYGEKIVGYELPKPAGDGAPAATETAAPAAPAFDPANVAGLVAAANVAEGQNAFKKCQACHTVDQGGANKIGPNLWGVVGRQKAAVDGFNYSAVLKDMGSEWSLENLASFLHDPSGYAKGTKMVFRGIGDDTELADLLAYLDTLK